MTKSLTQQFGLWRSFFWPVHKHEFKRVIPMFVMLFLTCLNYGILRNMKDTLIITAAGAKILPYIKLWGIVPVALLMTYIINKLNHKYSQEKVFYFVTGGFLIFYLLFAFALYPIRDSLHPYGSASFLDLILPQGFRGIIDLYRHWTLTLFYVMAELWSSVILSTLFWGFANEVTKMGEAKRIYGVFGIASNLGALVAGVSANGLAYLVHGSWEKSIYIFIMAITICGLIIMGIFWWLNKSVFKEEKYSKLHKVSEKSKKSKPTLSESFKLLSKSKYLASIATLVVSYNLVINLMDVVWKDRLHTLYPSPYDFNYYMNIVTSFFGFIALTLSCFIPKLIEKLGWTKTALITPVSMLITGVGFFSFLFFGDFFSGVASGAMTPLAIAVFFGSAQHCISKGAKYSVFDTTKEMTFIPLDHETKLKGKAPIDVVGARLGKSGGSVIYQSLLVFFNSISACIPFIAVILTFVLGFWISSARNLGKMFGKLSESQEQKEEEVGQQAVEAVVS